ncbi:MAG TPA: class I SAM-dependent methyltransferase [Myxococcales bacterium]|nr:class I SAM-dependent methyltransferase [Myxococcales bacterium]
MSEPWYVEFFKSGDYARVYSFEPERSGREAAFARAAIDLRPGVRVLDLCCGRGRHLRLMPGAVGVDLDLASLPGLPAACADMRALPLRTASLDAVVSLFSSFGYLETDEEDARVLREIARVLRPGGALLLDLLNREHALGGFVEQHQRVEEDGTLVVEQRSFDALASRLTTRFVVVAPDGARRDSVGHSLRLYTLTELSRMLAACGLRPARTHGGYGGEEYSLSSPRMIALARRAT